MVTVAQPLTAQQDKQSRSEWFWQFLKRELAPYPGRGWTVARMTMAATIVMLLIMVFRLPNAALGAYYTLLLSRENPRATLLGALSMLGSVAAALLYILLSAALFAGSPMLHFGWVALTLFIIFFLIDALSEYRMGTAFGFLAVNSITAWDFPANPSLLVESTLWTALAVSVGAVITVAVEYLSSLVHRQDQIGDGIVDRLLVIERAMRGLANNGEAPPDAREKLEQYAMTGTALLRRGIVRSGLEMPRKQEMSAIVALTGRLIDLTANVRTPPADDAERQRYWRAADSLAVIRQAIHSGDPTEAEKLSSSTAAASNGSFLGDLEMTIVEMPQILAGLSHRPEYFPSAIDRDLEFRLFKSGAFSNGDALRFALRGTLAALVCYVVYNAIAWRGLATSVATCMITALSNVGSSRQKQFLRVAGTVLGGIVLGMTAQVVLLPYLDSIASFTLLFVLVTALSGWIATSSPRLSYAGVQTGFAFYITHLRVFGPQTSLTVARDDVMGIFLGLLAMWLLFDTIWAKDAATEMAELFVSNLRRIAAFHSHIPTGTLAQTINKSRAERAAITGNFDQIRNLSDSIVFEFGPAREQKMELRRIVRALQPQLRAYFLLEISMLPYQAEPHPDIASSEFQQNATRSEEVLSWLADHAADAWAVVSMGSESKSLRARHDELCSLIERYERELRTEEARTAADPIGYATVLSRWMLAAALALGRSLIRLEQESVLEEQGLLSRSHPPIQQKLPAIE